MPEYLYPGVYVEEVDTGNKPIEGVSTSTVGFLGLAERGPTEPTFITSFTEFTRYYGSYFTDAAGPHYLAYALEGFFQNGGRRCFVARVTGDQAATSALDVDGKLTVSALGPGTSGDRIAVQVDTDASGTSFKLTVLYWKATPPNDFSNPNMVEVFDDLTDVETASGFYERKINNGLSTLITVEKTGAGIPVTAAPALLTGGSDVAEILGDFLGTNSPDPLNPKGLEALKTIDELSILVCPDEDVDFPNIAGALIAQCELMKDRFAILQSPQSAGLPGTHVQSYNSKYAAYYHPWLNVVNPSTGQTVTIPPGGHVAGIYARSDAERGVHKDPANEVVRGIESLQLLISKDQQALLNPRGINALRFFTGAGNLVWGGRTTTRDPDWKYINVRRLFIFVEKSIERGTQWVVFEPNDEPTWARVRRTITDFLGRLWMDGMLQGRTREEAYFVKCDRTTMTQSDIDNGRLICLIGIAPVKPAEFVIFRIGQWTGGSDVSEG